MLFQWHLRTVKHTNYVKIFIRPPIKKFLITESSSVLEMLPFHFNKTPTNPGTVCHRCACKCSQKCVFLPKTFWNIILNSLYEPCLQLRLQSEDYGKHLMGVEDLIQKHSLLESDIKVIGERVRTINGQADKFVIADFPEAGGTSFIALS